MRDERYRDVHERVWNAAEGLAIGTGPIKERLENAGLTLLPLREIEFAGSDLRQMFKTIMDELSKTPALDKKSGGMQATISRMTDEEAAATAGQIFQLFCMVAKRRR